MRNDFFDFSKGVLILLVILGHAIQYCAVNENVWINPVFNIIYTFHMPLFVFFSGYFFFSSMKKKFANVFISRFKRLIIPNLFNSIIIFLLFSLISKFQYDSLYQIWNLCKSYWFLICIFTLTVIFYLLYITKWIGLLVGVCTYICALKYYEYLPIMILRDCQVIRMFLIFMIGAIIGNIDRCTLNFIKNKYYILISIPVSLIIIVYIRVYNGINLMDYSPIIRIVDGIVCSNIALFAIYMFYLLSKKFIPKITCIVVEYGKQSLCFYLAHVILFRPLYMNNIFLFKDISVVNVIITFVIFYLFSLYYTYCFKNRLFNQLFLGRY